MEYEYSDLGNARRLVERIHGRWWYVRGVGWLQWDGRRFVPDPKGSGLVKEAASMLDGLAAEGSEADRKWARRSASERNISAMIRLAAADPRVEAEIGDFDSDPMILNLQNGVIQLNDFGFTPSAPEFKCLKVAGCKFDSNAECPVWERFLREALGGDPKLLEFVQRAVGYSLTGLTLEQCLFLLVGPGGTGKTTFLEAIRAILGDYAASTDSTTFARKPTDSPRNDLAKLVGVRYVTSPEFPHWAKVDEVALKLVTGEDRISARFLYREYFEFKPMFKLWISSNHYPEIEEHGNAIWRRIRVIPFNFQPQRRDPELLSKLRQELPGILNWALDGLADYLQEGIEVPDQIRKIIGAYQDDMDQVGLFLKEETEIDPNSRVTKSDLYEAYVKWCEANCYDPMNRVSFGIRLSGRGLRRGRIRLADGKTVQAISGIRLKG